jgi:hypothetical protein
MNSKFFETKMNGANENFHSADGWGNADGWGQDKSFGGQELFNAVGAGEVESSPYVIVIENTTTNELSNIVILDAAEKQFGFTQAGADITFDADNVTYRQFLAQIASGMTFKVGKTRLTGEHATSTSYAESQALTRLTVSTVDVSDGKVSKTFRPRYDLYQQIKTQTNLPNGFDVNSMTSITIGYIKPLATLKIELFPIARINTLKQIQGGGSEQGYGDPQTDPLLKK